MPTAEFVSNLRSSRLPQKDLDEESIFSIGWDHDLLDVWVCWAFIAAERERQNTQLDFTAGLTERNFTRAQVSCRAFHLSIYFIKKIKTKAEQVSPHWGDITWSQSKRSGMGGWLGVVMRADVHSPDGHVSVLGLAWLGTALQWCLGDSWHGFVHQHLLVLYSLTCSTKKYTWLIHVHYVLV